MGGPGREVHEEGLVGHQRLLPAHPLDGVVGQVFGEVIAFLGGLCQLDRRGALVERGVVLVGLGADEAVEILEAAAGRPGVVRAGRAGLPTGHFMALAELRRGVAVQLERLGQRGAGLGADRAVAGRRGGHLGDAAHADRVVVAPGQQRLARRRAEGGGVEAVVLEPVRRQPLGGGRVARGRRRRTRRQSPHRRSARSARWARPWAAAAARSADTSCPGPWRRRWSSPTCGMSGMGRISRWILSWVLMSFAPIDVRSRACPSRAARSLRRRASVLSSLLPHHRQMQAFLRADQVIVIVRALVESGSS